MDITKKAAPSPFSAFLRLRWQNIQEDSSFKKPLKILPCPQRGQRQNNPFIKTDVPLPDIHQKPY